MTILCFLTKHSISPLLTTYRALGLVIGQQLLISGLRTAVPHHSHVVTAQEVIAYGPQGLNFTAKTPEILEALRWAYSDALRGTIIIGLVGAALAAPVACFMEWLNVKMVAAQQKAQEELQKSDSCVEEEKAGEEEKAPVAAVDEVDGV